MPSTDTGILPLRVAFCGTETVAGNGPTTFAAATDAFCIMPAGTSITAKRTVNKAGNVCYASLGEQVGDLWPGAWEIDGAVEMAVMPSGTAGTPPDAHPIWLACLPAYANSGGVSDTYDMVPDAKPKTFWMVLATVRNTGSQVCVSYEYAAGCVVTNFSLAGDKGTVPKLTAQFKATRYASMTSATVDGAHLAGDTTIAVDTLHGYRLQGTSTAIGKIPLVFVNESTGAIVEDNSGSYYAASAAASALVTMTALAQNVADNREIRAVVPASRTLAGYLVPPRLVCTWGGETLYIQSWKLDCATGADIDTDTSADYPVDVHHVGKREVKFEIAAKVDSSDPLLDILSAPTVGITSSAVAIGYNTGSEHPAGKRFAVSTYAVPEGNAQVGPVGEGLFVVTLSGSCKESTAGDGEDLKVVFS